MPDTSSLSLRYRSHTVKPLAAHTHTVIFLHDRGSDATEFALRLFDSHESATRLSLRDTFPSFKWIFPYAPAAAPKHQIASNDFGILQWFDVWDAAHPQEKRSEQRPTLIAGVSALVHLVQREIREGGIAAHHIFLAGIGQGMALAAHALLHLNVSLAGLMGFNSWLPFRNEVHSIAAGDDWDGTVGAVIALTGAGEHSQTGEAQLETPVLLSHSSDDSVVPFENGVALRDTLKALGMRVEWHEYAYGGHWIQEPQGIDDLAAFLRKSIAKHYLMDKRLSMPVVPSDLIPADGSLKVTA